MTKNEIIKKAKTVADRENVPTDIVLGVIRVESDFVPTAESPVGAKGLMQIMPINYKSLGITDPFDVDQNINGGIRLLARLFKRFGTWEKALAAYNWGSGNVRKKPNRSQWPKSVRRYVDKVLTSSKSSNTAGILSVMLLIGMVTICLRLVALK